MALSPDYVTLEEFQAYLRIDEDDDTDDDQLELAITAASRAIDRSANRQFGLNGSAVARVYTPEWSRTLSRYVVEIDDLMTQTGLEVASSTSTEGTFDLAHTTYRLTPFNAPSDGRPWTKILFAPGTSVNCGIGTVEVTGNWGWTAVPTTIQNATLIQASRFLKRRDSAFGIAGSPDLGNELRLLDRIDPDVAVMISAYRRWWGASR